MTRAAAQVRIAKPVERRYVRWSLVAVRQAYKQLTARVQRLEGQQDALRALRNWIGWLYWQDALHPAIEFLQAFVKA